MFAGLGRFPLGGNRRFRPWGRLGCQQTERERIRGNGKNKVSQTQKPASRAHGMRNAAGRDGQIRERCFADRENRALQRLKGGHQAPRQDKDDCRKARHHKLLPLFPGFVTGADENFPENFRGGWSADAHSKIAGGLPTAMRSGFAGTDALSRKVIHPTIGWIEWECPNRGPDAPAENARRRGMDAIWFDGKHVDTQDGLRPAPHVSLCHVRAEPPCTMPRPL